MPGRDVPRNFAAKKSMRRFLTSFRFFLFAVILSTVFSRVFAQAPTLSILALGEAYLESNTVCFSVGIENPLPASSTSVDIVVDLGTTATQGLDFNVNPATVEFPAGIAGAQYVCLGFIDDAVYEPVEYINLALANATNNAVITNGTIAFAVYDNDSISMTFPCQQPFISEYLHSLDNGDSRALEIFNPTLSNVSLNGYNVRVFHNGAVDPTTTIPLDGFLAPGSVLVVAHSESVAAVQAQADLLTPLLNFTGDDAVGLFQGDVLVDVVGVIGQDPGLYWPAGIYQTASADLVRNPVIRQGETSWYISAGHWTGSPQSQYGNLGAHTMLPCGPDGTFPPLITLVTIDAAFDESIGGLGIQAALYYPKDTETAVEVTVGNGSTAVPGQDFLIEPATLVFPANFTGTMGIGITVLDDLIAEPAETLVLTLSNASNGGVFQDSVWVLTILDNDASGVTAAEAAGTPRISPNPVAAGGVLSVRIPRGEARELLLQNAAGAWSQHFFPADNQGEAANWKIRIPGGLPGGIYALSVRTDVGVFVKKVVVR